MTDLLLLEAPLLAVAFAGVVFFARVHRFFIAGHFLAALGLLVIPFVRGAVLGRLGSPSRPSSRSWAPCSPGAGSRRGSRSPAPPRRRARRSSATGRPAIVFFVASSAARSEEVVRRLGLATAALVAFESLYGIAEHFGGHEHILLWPKKFPGSVSGTYENRDHFAGMLAATTPLLVALGQDGERLWRPELPLRQRIVVAMDEPSFWPRALVLSADSLGSLGACLSLSRGGVLALVFGLLVYGGLSTARERTRSALLGVATIVFFSGLALLAYGADPLIDRFGKVSENMGELSMGPSASRRTPPAEVPERSGSRRRRDRGPEDLGGASPLSSHSTQIGLVSTEAQ